jgi:CBS domain-containing protein
MGKTVRDAMTPSVRTASPAQSLAHAAQLMKSDDVGSMPIVEEGRLGRDRDRPRHRDSCRR